MSLERCSLGLPKTKQAKYPWISPDTTLLPVTEEHVNPSPQNGCSSFVTSCDDSLHRLLVEPCITAHCIVLGVCSNDIEIVMPGHLSATSSSYTPHLSEASMLLTQQHCILLAAALPARHQHKPWALAYSTTRHGISLQTLYRKSAAAAGGGPALLVMKDSGGEAV